MTHLKHPATIIAALALFVALGGGAAWASGLIPGSKIKNHSIATKKLTKKAIKQLKGNRGPQGPAGPAGAAGPQGAQGVQGPIGPSNAFTFFRDSGVNVTSVSTTVATASLAAGDYVILAKTYIDSNPITDAVGYTTCTLTAGSDSDQSSLNLGGQAQQVSRGSLAMMVSHVYAAAGTAVVRCFTGNSVTTTVTANWTKITAIKVGSVTNTSVTG